MQDYTLDELEDYDNTSITIDDALWIGEDMYEQSEDLVDITYRITKGDFTHQIF